MTYTATVEWDGYYWVAHLDGHPGAVTQARSIDGLRPHLVEVVKLMLDRTITVDDIELHFVDFDQADEVRAMRADLHAIETALAERTQRTATALRNRGFSVRDIGSLLGISYQRVDQLLHR